ncbi:MAG: phosphomannomutase/phosphoglucomutase [Patescibacteria group bacterium]
MVLDPSIFKDYDIRGIVPGQLDETGIIRLTQAIVHYFKPRSVQLGHDMRLSSAKFHQAMITTFLVCGVDVVDLGLIATDMLYFASGTGNEDMNITLSASHNPSAYNGLKMVKKGAIPISGANGIYALRDLALSKAELTPKNIAPGHLTSRNLLPDWVNHVLKFVDVSKLKPFKLVIDAGNAMAGYFMPAFEKKLPFSVSHLYYELDGSFPHHVPSPIEAKNLQDLITAVKSQGADAGLAFDGDGDRVFLIDSLGRVVSGTVMTAIIAENLLLKHPGDTILYNAIVGQIVPEIIAKHQGRPVRVKVGHTLIKAAMRQEQGLFCGEHSGHYYFRDNFFADSAIIAALLVLELMSEKNLTLSDLIDQYSRYFSFEEKNFKVSNPKKIIQTIFKKYEPQAKSIDWLDGLSVWFDTWWFSLRASNTEPLLRLNLEADSPEILTAKTKELQNELQLLGAEIL